MANPSPIIFAGALALKVRKIKIKIQFQRNEASQRLVKHNIVISLHSFLKTFSACCFDFNGRREVYLKFTNASLQNTVLHEAYSIRSLSHIHVSTVSFLHSLLLLFHFCVFLSRLSELVWKLAGEIIFQLALKRFPSLGPPANGNESNAKKSRFRPNQNLIGTIYHWSVILRSYSKVSNSAKREYVHIKMNNEKVFKTNKIQNKTKRQTSVLPCSSITLFA